MWAKVAQAETTDQGILDQRGGRLGEQHLPTMASLFDARMVRGVLASTSVCSTVRVPPGSSRMSWSRL
jgi:hypothetical protein